MINKDMTSKERVLAAMNHQETDRIPVSFAANKFVRREVMESFNAGTHRELLDQLHSDIVDLRDCVAPEYVGPGDLVKELEGNVHENYWGWRTRVVETPRGPEEQYAEFQLQQAETLESLEKHPWPDPDWFDFSGFAEKLAPYSDLCVMASGGSVFQHPTFLRGMDNFLMDLILNPEMAEFLMDKFTGFYLAYFQKMFECAPGQIDVFRVADDVAMQTGLLISEEMFDQYVAPRLKKLIDLAHNHGIKFMFHSCGDVSLLIPRFIDLGIDILDPVQVAASNMDLFEIHQKYGDKICLHGGIDTQKFLPNATPARVRQKIREVTGYFRDKTGYILSTSHVIEGDISTDKIRAFFDECYQFQM